MNKNITIIVPIYKDWITLEKCLNSLKKYVDKRHTVLLINDNSTEADDLEKKIKDTIKGEGNFKYYRNKGNLGFVKTCNKGVFKLDETENDILLLNSDTEVTEGFLDEMIDVMNANDRHGAVCPRSNNATILSIPFLYEGERSDIIRKSYESWEKIKDKLPRFKKIPTGVGFCMLIRRDLIKNFGLFDEIYGKGYNEENDFCCRINKFGYSVVMANRAFVFHFEGKSFGVAGKNEQEKKNVKILTQRYPEFPFSVEKYYSIDVDPIDHFADVVGGVYPRKRILFSLYNLPPLHNGTSEYGISLLKHFYDLYHEKYEIDVLTNKEGDAFHKISEKFNVYYKEQGKKIYKRYDLAISPSQIFEVEHLTILNKCALRIVVVMQDIISWRSNYLNRNEYNVAADFTMRFSDGIIAISDFVKNDILSYFNTISIDSDRISVVHHGIEKHENFVHDGEKNPFGKNDYVLVIGNHFKHKMIKETVRKLKDSPLNFVVMGLGKESIDIETKSNFLFLKSGNLSDGFINDLFKHCSFILFPSQYEGFGLPILKALKYGKKIALFENVLNKEIKEEFQIPDHQIFFFKYFSELPDLITHIAKSKESVDKMKDLRSWEDVVADTERFISSVIDMDIDNKKLRDRWNILNDWMIMKNNSSGSEYKRDFWDMLNPKNIILKIVFILFSPKKFYRKYKKKTRELFSSWIFSAKTEGYKKSLKRMKNYITKGKGVLD